MIDGRWRHFNDAIVTILDIPENINIIEYAQSRLPGSIERKYVPYMLFFQRHVPNRNYPGFVNQRIAAAPIIAPQQPTRDKDREKLKSRGDQVNKPLPLPKKPLEKKESFKKAIEREKKKDILAKKSPKKDDDQISSDSLEEESVKQYDGREPTDIKNINLWLDFEFAFDLKCFRKGLPNNSSNINMALQKIITNREFLYLINKLSVLYTNKDESENNIIFSIRNLAYFQFKSFNSKNKQNYTALSDFYNDTLAFFRNAINATEIDETICPYEIIMRFFSIIRQSIDKLIKSDNAYANDQFLLECMTFLTEYGILYDKVVLCDQSHENDSNLQIQYFDIKLEKESKNYHDIISDKFHQVFEKTNYIPYQKYKPNSKELVKCNELKCKSVNFSNFNLLKQFPKYQFMVKLDIFNEKTVSILISY